MKKLIAVTLILALLLPAAALADLPDISGLSLDELYQLNRKIRSEILSRSQWGTVTVPEGYYVVGEDIPEGHWTITYLSGSYSMIEVFEKADATGHAPANIMDDYQTYVVCDPQSEYAYVSPYKEIDLTLPAGYHVVISSGPAVFRPFTGRQSPFFD